MNLKTMPSIIRSFSERHRQLLAPILFSLLGTGFLFWGIQKYKAHLGFGMEKTPILIAQRALSEGETLSLHDLNVQSIPKRYAPLGVLLNSDQKHIHGRVVKRPVAQGAMLTWSDLDIEFTPAVPARRIAKGYRALSISVDSVASVANAVRPGDHVDIITTTKMLGDDGPKTLTLLQNVSILDVGRAGQRGEAYSSVTLMVLPKEVGLISFAAAHEKLHLVLRNPDDYETLQDLPMIGQPDLVEAAFRNSMQQERNRAVEVIKGGQLTFTPGSQ